MVVLLCCVVLAGDEAVDTSDRAYPQAWRFRGARVLFLSPCPLEGCGWGAESATLHLGGHLQADPLSSGQG